MLGYFRTAAAAVTLTFGLIASAGSALAVTCTGTANSALATEVLFDATAGTCTIQTGGVFSQIDNTFAFFARPDIAPDHYLGVKDDSGGAGGAGPADSLFVSGIEATTLSGIYLGMGQNLSGSFVAVLVAELFDVTYEMTLNLRADGGSNIWVDSASVERVIPVPAALPLLASGLGLLGLSGWRRKSKAPAAA